MPLDHKMLMSEYNVWPAERPAKAPEGTAVLPSAMLKTGPLVSMLPTPADQEAQRARASADESGSTAPTLVTIFPRSMPNTAAIPVPLYSQAQLERLSDKGLKQLAMKLRDTLEQSGAMPDAPKVLPSSQAMVVIRWVLSVQVHLCAAAGLQDITLASFGAGAPPDENLDE
jgi:hypothetical protein